MAVIDAGTPAVFVSEKPAAVSTPLTVAFTMYGPPGVALAVKADDVATPFASVVAVTKFKPPANVALEPKVGEVNVTVAPLTGLAPASLTVTISGAANAVLTGALCPLPLVAVIDAGAPPVFVRE